MKKGILLTTLLALLYGIFWLFFYQTDFRTPFSDIHSLEAVPQNSAMVIEFENYFQTRTALTKMAYAKEFQDAFFVKKLSEDLRLMRKVFSKTTAHRRLLLYSRLMAALQISNADDADFLHIIKDEKNVFDLDEVLKHYTYKKFESNGSTVYELAFNERETITIGYFNGIILLSKYAFLVENGMRQLQQFPSPLITDEKFAVFKTQEDHPVNVYILFENLPIFAHPFLNDVFKNKLTSFAQIISSAKLGLDFQKNGVEITGALNRTDRSFLLERFFANEKEKKTSQLKDIIPDDIAFLIQADLPNEKTMKLQSPNDNEMYEKYFQPWLHEEWALGCAKIFTRRIESEQFVLYKMEDFKKAKYHLSKLADDLGELRSTDYLTFPIQQILTDHLPVPILGNEFSYIKNPWCTYVEDYVIFSASLSSLENWIDKYLTNQTLSENEAFLQLENRIGTAGNIGSFWNTTGTLPLMKSYFRSSTKGKIFDQVDAWGTMQPIGFQLDVNEELINLNGFFNYQEAIDKPVATLWKAKLEHKIIVPPAVHFSKKTNDHHVLVQDESLRLYAFNSSGEKMWNVLLEDSIQSEIFAMDVFDKGEKVFIFNTKKYLHILDQEGNRVHTFPLPLPTNATNGLTIVDFGEKEFAFFVACGNGEIYGYNKNGLPLLGWNPREGTGSITQSLQHFQKENKDYLIALNDEGDLMSFGKNGKKIMTGTNVSGVSDRPLFFHKENTTQMILADAAGSPHTLEVNEKNVLLNMMVKETNSMLFASADWNNDDKIDFAKLTGRSLEIFQAKEDGFKLAGKYNFSNNQHAIFSVGNLSAEKKMIGTLNPYHKQIFLLNEKGKLHPAFPLEGTTTFQLINGFNHNKKAIVVGSDNEVVVYEIDSYIGL